MQMNEEKELNLDEFLGSVYDDIQEREAVKTPETEENTQQLAEAGQPDEAAAPKQTPKKDNQRDQKGRFYKAGPADGQEDSSPESDTEPVQKAAKQPAEPRERWSARNKELFSKLSPEGQEIILNREREEEQYLTRKTQELAAKSREYESLEQVIAPRRPVLQRMGMSESQAINELFALSEYSNRDPVGFITRFAHDNNIDLGRLVNQHQSQQQQIDPQLQPVLQKVSQLESFVQQQQQLQEMQTHQRVAAEMDAFRADPQNKHFEKVRYQMGDLIKAGLASTYRDAYDKACKLVPEVYQEIIAEQQKAFEEQRIREAKEAAAKARKTQGVQIKPLGNVSGSAPAAKNSRSVDQTIEWAAQQHYGNA